MKAVDLTLAWAYLASHYKGRENRKLFNIVQTYCMFITTRAAGAPIKLRHWRHTNTTIALELDAL